MRSTGSFFIGLIAGAALGAAYGLLYAPEKGEATREKLGQKANDLREDLDGKFDELKNYVQDAIGDMKEKVVEMKEKVVEIKEKITKTEEEQAEEA